MSNVGLRKEIMEDATPIDNTTGGTVADTSQPEPKDTNPEEEKEVEEKPEVKETKTEEKTTSEKSEDTPSKEDKVETDKDGESFTKSFDPKKLSPELQEAYKQMQADYTRKTQDIARVRKAAEAYERFRPHLQKIFADENLSKQVFGVGKDQPQGEVEYPDDPVEFAKAVKAEAIADVRKEIEAREKQRAAMEADSRDRDQAEKVDSRLSEDPEFAKNVAGIVLQDPDYRSRRISAVEATKRAVKKFDDYVERVAKSKNEALIKKAKNSSSSGVSKKTSPSSTVSSNKALSIRDAWKEAERELAKK